MTARREALGIAGLTIVLLLPFIGKAFHIDDTLFLKAARQIRTSPLDFYGFTVNWYGTERPMSDVMKNPPLASYFLALASAAVGWSETGLHAAFLLPALVAALGVYTLSRRLTARPGLATLAALATPAFLVSSTNLMCDTMLVAFWVWATERWVAGIESRRPAILVFAGILVSLAALTKYFGMALVPLLFVYGLARTRRIGAWALALIVPVAALASYQLWTQALYGRGLLSDAATYASVIRFRSGGLLSARILVGLSFTGGCLASAAFFAPWLWGGRALGAAAIVAVILATVLAAAGRLGTFPLSHPGGVRISPIAQIVVFAVAGAGLLALAFADLLHRRDAGALLLFAWIIGTLAFTVFFNWTVNARSLLPAAPAVGIVLARRIETRAPGLRRVAVVPLLAAAALAFSVAWADDVLAGTARTAAGWIARVQAPGTSWFEGHWGFQHYMEAAGGLPLDYEHSRLSAADRIAIPVNNTNLFPLPANAVSQRSALDLPAFPFLATLSPELGAGFYLDAWGPLPFAFGRVPAEHYVLLDVLRGVPPGGIRR